MTTARSDPQTAPSDGAPDDLTVSKTAADERGGRHDPHEPPSVPSECRTEGALQALTDQIAASRPRIVSLGQARQRLRDCFSLFSGSLSPPENKKQIDRATRPVRGASDHGD